MTHILRTKKIARVDYCDGDDGEDGDGDDDDDDHNDDDEEAGGRAKEGGGKLAGRESLWLKVAGVGKLGTADALFTLFTYCSHIVIYVSTLFTMFTYCNIRIHLFTMFTNSNIRLHIVHVHTFLSPPFVWRPSLDIKERFTI